MKLFSGNDIKEHTEGWEWKGNNHTRPVRDDEYGKAGQAIWSRLCELKFVARHNNLNNPETDDEKQLKEWLIWGYWETENPAAIAARNTFFNDPEYKKKFDEMWNNE